MIVWMLAGAAIAAADPPGPTDYLSSVTEIEPNVPGIDVEVVGGDSFVVLTVERGVTVEVIGYSGEPYLRFSADGTVEENRLSPSRYLNRDRYAAVAIPDEADAGAVPDWVVVAGDGSFAWHDHRTHWMASIRPPGKGPGDEIAEGVIPLIVDGVAVDVTVASVWQPPPSGVPVVFGVTIGLLAAFVALRLRGRVIAVILISAAVSAATVGIAAYASVPAETGPPWVQWALPATALALTAIGLVSGQRLTAGSYRTLQILGATELVIWGVRRWDWLRASILPSRLPFWIDRFIGAAVLVCACGVVGAVLLDMVRPAHEVPVRP